MVINHLLNGMILQEAPGKMVGKEDDPFLSDKVYFQGRAVKFREGILGMVIPPIIGNPDNGYLNPYCKVDDHP